MLLAPNALLPREPAAAELPNAPLTRGGPPLTPPPHSLFGTRPMLHGQAKQQHRGGGAGPASPAAAAQ